MTPLNFTTACFSAIGSQSKNKVKYRITTVFQYLFLM